MARPLPPPYELDRAPLAYLAVVAWMREAGQPWQSAFWVDASDWLAYHAFLAGEVLDGLAYNPFSAWHAHARYNAEQKRWVGPCAGNPHAVLAEGTRTLRRHREFMAVSGARLSWLAGHLPLADQSRSTAWMRLCCAWLGAEAARGPCTAQDLAGLEQISGAVTIGQQRAILTNLERLRATATERFGHPATLA